VFKKVAVLWVAAIVLCAFRLPCCAQNHVVLTEDSLPSGAPPPPVCIQEGEAFLRIASEFPLVHQWTFYIVCDERSWHRFVRRSGQLDHGVSVNGVAYHSRPDVQIYGTTYLQLRVSYIRGTKLLHPDLGITPAHIVAHELAHILLNSLDEVRVDHVALSWVAQHQETGHRVVDVDVASAPAPSPGFR
jgi:hypothetical protein